MFNVDWYYRKTKDLLNTVYIEAGSNFRNKLTSNIGSLHNTGIEFSTTDRYFGFTNLLCNYLGGTHVQELSKTIVTTWKEFIESHKNVKPAVELKNNDYLVGLRAVCAIFIAKPEFSSQTKEQ